MSRLEAILKSPPRQVSAGAVELAAEMLRLMEDAQRKDSRLATFLSRVGDVCQAHPPLHQALRRAPGYRRTLAALMAEACRQRETYRNALCAAQMAQCQVKLGVVCNQYWRGWGTHSVCALDGVGVASLVLAAGKLAADLGKRRLHLSKPVLEEVVRAVKHAENPASKAQLAPQQVSNVSLGCAKLGLDGGALWARLTTAAGREAAGLTGQGVATVLWSWGKVGAQPHMFILQRVLRQLEQTAPRMNAQDLAMCVLGLSGMCVRPDEQTWMAVRRGLLTALSPSRRRSAFGTQALSNVALSLARLALADDEVLEALLAAAVRVPAEAGWSVQERANVMWACACFLAVLARHSGAEGGHAALAGKLEGLLLDMLRGLAGEPWQGVLHEAETAQVLQAAQALGRVPEDARELLEWCGAQQACRLQRGAEVLEADFSGLKAALERLNEGGERPVSVKSPEVVNAYIVDAVLEAEGTRGALVFIRMGSRTGAVVRGVDGAMCCYHGGLQLQLHVLERSGLAVVSVVVDEGVALEQYADSLQAAVRRIGIPL